MKVGIFTDTYKPQINGVVTSVCLMEQKLRENGHEPYIFTVTHPDVRPLKDPDNVFRISSVKFWGNTEHRIAKLYSQKMLHKVKDLDIDIIHSHAPFSLGIMGHLIARRLGIPEVHTYHTMLSDYTHYIKFGHLMPKEAAENYSRVFCNRVDAVIVPTPKVYEALKNYGVKKPMYVIPTGIDLPQFLKKVPENELELIRKNLNILPDDKLLIFVGRIAKEKSIDKLIHYHKALSNKDPKFKLLIVGGGDYLDELKSLVESLSLSNKVLFAGKSRYEELPHYYQIAKCFVTASTSETQGLVVLEAAASGLPVVAINDESYNTVLFEGQNGLYYHTEDEYIAALEKLFANPEAMKVMGTKSLEIADSFSSDNFYNRIMNVYTEAIANYKKK